MKPVNCLSKLMRTYSSAAEAVGSGFDMNPSPGNIKDGLITDAIKSAGAAKKGGTAPVADVLQYAEYIKKPGLIYYVRLVMMWKAQPEQLDQARK